MNNTPYVYAYARVSTEMQAESLEGQIDEMIAGAEDIAENIEGDFIRCRADSLSAVEVPYSERQEFKKLLIELREGDHLVVRQLDRIDRDPRRILEAIHFFHKRGVVLHSLSKGTEPFDVEADEQDYDRMMLEAWFSRKQIAYIRERTRPAMAAHKANGLPVSTYRYGWKRKSLPRGPKQRRNTIWVPCERERQQIRRIVARHDAGESMVQIAQEFDERRLLTAEHRPWGKKRPCNGRLNVNRFYRVYQVYKQHGENWDAY